MKRCGLLLAALVSMVLTACVLHRARCVARPAPAADGGATTLAGWHYFHGGPRHWRAYMLHP
jgi:hypothetical protein